MLKLDKATQLLNLVDWDKPDHDDSDLPPVDRARIIRQTQDRVRDWIKDKDKFNDKVRRCIFLARDGGLTLATS